MSQALYTRTALTGITTVFLLGALPSIAQAQDATTASEQGEFIGTLTLGESKREVQTDTATPLTVIDQEEIDDRQASTIAELIDSVPGVTLVNGSTPAGSGINIRGFGSNSTFGTDQKVAIQVDGASTGSEELYRIGTQLFTDPYLYRQVDVIRGSVGGFEYGSGIVGGVVRLETRDASDFTGGEPGFRLAQTFGIFSNNEGFNSSTIAAWQPTDNIEILGNFSYREQDEQNDGDGDEIGNSAFDLPSWLLKGRLSFGEGNAHSITASYTQSEASDRDVPYDTFNTTGFGNVDRDTTTQTASLIYNYNPVSNDLIDLDVAFSYANQEFDQQSSTGSLSPLLNADHQYETTKLTVRNSAFLETGVFTHDLRIGAEYIDKERLDAFAAPGGTDTRYALFLVDQIEFFDSWTLTPALRYETQDLDGDIPDPADGAGPDDILNVNYDHSSLLGGVSLRYDFDNGLGLFVSYAYTESFPILDDLEILSLVTQPEIANTYEAGVSYDRVGLFSDSDAFAFKTNYYNTLLGDVTSTRGVTDVEVDGFEIESSYAQEGGFYIDFNANIVSGEETLMGNRSGTIPAGTMVDWRNTPADSLRLTAGQRIDRTLDFSAELIAVAEAERDSFSFFGVPQNETTPGHVTLNLRTTLRPQAGLLEGMELRMGLENVLDHQYTPLLATRPATGRNLKLTLSRLF